MDKSLSQFVDFVGVVSYLYYNYQHIHTFAHIRTFAKGGPQKQVPILSGHSIGYYGYVTPLPPPCFVAMEIFPWAKLVDNSFSVKRNMNMEKE